MIEVLIAVSTFLITLNNTSLIRDYVHLSGIVSRRYAKYLITFPIAIGLATEGYKLTIYADKVGIPPTERLFLILFITLVFLIGTIMKIPTSATLVTVGASIGISLYLGGEADLNYLTLLTILWITFPLAAIILSKALYDLFIEIHSRWIQSISIIPTFLVSYVFGANTLGLIVHLDPDITPIEMMIYILIVLTATLIPSQKIGESITRFMYGYTWRSYLSVLTTTAFLIEIAHNLSIPMPLTTVLTLATLGPVIGRELVFINTQKIKKSIWFWAATLTLSITLSYLSFTAATLIFSS